MNPYNFIGWLNIQIPYQYHGTSLSTFGTYICQSSKSSFNLKDVDGLL
jgi:hypothetical protein